MKIRLIGDTKIIMSNPNGSHNYFGWPTVVRLQNGEIAVGASGYRVEHICPFGKAVLMFSKDEGESYSEPVAVIDTVLDDRDVGLTPFGESGLIFTSFTNPNEFQRENMPQTQECFDCVNAVTPEEEAKVLGVTMKISNDCGKSFGELYRPPVSSPHGPTVLNDGTILWVGRVLGSHNGLQAHILNPENGEAQLVGKIDVSPFDHLNFYEPHAIQLPNGRIICHMRVENDEETIFTLFQSVSDDNGRTWSPVRQIITDTSGAPAHLYMHSSGVLITAYSHRAYPYGIRVCISEDGGESWGEEFTLFENIYSDDLGYPSTVELSDGSLLTVFYARESTEDYPAVIMQQKWAIEK